LRNALICVTTLPGLRIAKQQVQRAAFLRAPNYPIDRRHRMNWDRIEGNWKQFKGKAKERWGRLTDDELEIIAGRRDQLLGTLQEQYGIDKDEAEAQVRDFESRL
jgi:uncharacterized protein YjbJ (UPF0337 family)